MPTRPAAVVSCHLERPLDDDAWRAFVRIARRRPGGFPILALMRPPHDGENRSLWLERAHEAASLGPFGHHTHWTSPAHARPTGGDPAARVREEAAWLRVQQLAPAFFCGGAWYMDEAVAEAVAESGYVDCTVRGREPCRVRLGSGNVLAELPTTHSVGALARGVVAALPRAVHAYFHDYDLLDPRRRAALVVSLVLLARRRAPADPNNTVLLGMQDAPLVDFSEAFAR